MQADVAAAVAAFQQTGSKAAAAKLLGIPISTLKGRLSRSGDTEIGAQVREALDGYIPPKTFAPAPELSDTDLATLYPLADLHVGLLSWQKETGFNYDLKIGKKTIEGAMSRLFAVTPSSKQAVVLGLGDLLHADNYAGMTAQSKNILDVDGRWPRVLSTATQLVIYTIDLALQKHESVLVRILPGNHDEQSAIAVTLGVSCYYHNNPRVTVDDDAGRFWWWQFGKVLLGATHGDKAKPAQLPLVMAQRNPEAWGKTKFRHIFTGHIHQDSAKEILGVKVESLQAPCAPDAWHTNMGYGAGRSVQAITYHKERGKILRHYENIV
jgi:hypothetical protein